MVNILPLLTTIMSLVKFDPWTLRVDINSCAIKPPHLMWKYNIIHFIYPILSFKHCTNINFNISYFIDIFSNGVFKILFLKYFQWHTWLNIFQKCTLIWINYFLNFVKLKFILIMIHWKKNSSTWFINEKYFRTNI